MTGFGVDLHDSSDLQCDVLSNSFRFGKSVNLSICQIANASLRDRGSCVRLSRCQIPNRRGSMSFRPFRVLLTGLLALTIGGLLAVAAPKKTEPAPAKKAEAPVNQVKGGNSKAPATATQPPEQGVIATVGDLKITDADLSSSMPPDRQTAFQRADQSLQGIERQAI